ncbi:SAM-dependent methyltransferase [Dysgonomonas sp. 25]|uniref:THUMP-like domain-containing protein n=1 Tax=Dysgonomonas sp. 25 TaxID=2302933 RepID=UPI0013CF6B42|nr:SAM-dependent methyltransferase [Dysgonomonas sp. 25]NDV67548.1 SAM-dependent methyltransferase [Dysgonomonas sp. 25]
MQLSPDTKRFIEEHESDDIHSLALHASRFPQVDMALAIQQIKGKQIAKEKIPSWYKVSDILYPKHLSMEQCSSEYTARYKATLLSGSSLVDLTGGFGVDIAFLFPQFKDATYVEQQEELAGIAQHNFAVLNLDIQVVNADAVDYLHRMTAVDCIYIDPARRDIKGRKIVSIEDCTPNLLEIEPLLEEKAKRTMIKLSPMLDISLAVKSLKGIAEVHIISHNNECKELLFIKDSAQVMESPRLQCVNIHHDKTDIFSFSREEEDEINLHYTNEIGRYLYEPNSSVLKAGAYKSIAQYYGIDKLHVNSHLYTSDNQIDGFQGRAFEVVAATTLNKSELKDKLGNIKQANISTRNFPLSPQELKKRLGLKDGGNTYIFGTTLGDGHKVLIICRKAD